MIYDLTMYSGEWEILLIRLETLKDVIDKFIILESNVSHSLIKKPLFFIDQKEKFAKFSDKIIYIVKDSFHSNAFYNDWENRLNLFNAIPSPKYNDIIHFSDVDEISDPEILKETLNNLVEPVNFESKYFFYCLDLYGRQSNDGVVMKYGWFNQPIYKYRDERNSPHIKRIKGGWHYSSVNTPENICRKWAYFAHFNEINNKYKDPNYIISQIKRKAGSWNHEAPDNELKLVPHEYPYLPKYLLKNKEKFAHLFWEYYNK